MNAMTWKHGLGALLICVGVGACDRQTTGQEQAQAPAPAPAATAPAIDTAPPATTTTPETDAYASTPQVDESDTMATDADMTGTETTGDTLGDRCAGFTGEALTDCLEMESARHQEVQKPTLQDPTTQDPNKTAPQDEPQL